MTDSDLTALSTLLWTIATGALFILLAQWSDGSSWGITAGIARGLRTWSGREAADGRGRSSALQLPTIDPEPRPIGGVAAARLPPEAPPDAELIDLGEHAVPRR